MTEINIAGAIKEVMVFDDPDYCNRGDDRCPYLTGTIQCELFMELLCYGHNPPTNFKCDECKAAYQKSKTVGFKTEPFPHKDGGAPKSVTLTINGKDFLYNLSSKRCECEPFQSCEVCEKLNTERNR